MNKALLISFVLALVVGCSSKGPHPSPGEGDEEYDPGTPSAEPGDSGFDEDDDPGDLPRDPMDDTGDSDGGIFVCYPGLNELGDTCFPLVEAGSDLGDGYAYPEPYLDNPQYNPPTRYIDLRVTDHSTAVAPNFNFGEFMSVTKGPFGLFQVHAVETLQAIREASGGAITVNSGYRNVTYNEGVGGAEHSRHIYGDAVDMTSAVLSLSALVELCEDFGAGFTRLYDSHVHCDWRDDPLDTLFFE